MKKVGKNLLLEDFNSKEEMQQWIYSWNSMDGEDCPPFFNEICVYKGKTKDLNEENLINSNITAKPYIIIVKDDYK